MKKIKLRKSSMKLDSLDTTKKLYESDDYKNNLKDKFWDEELFHEALGQFLEGDYGDIPEYIRLANDKYINNKPDGDRLVGIYKSPLENAKSPDTDLCIMYSKKDDAIFIMSANEYLLKGDSRNIEAAAKTLKKIERGIPEEEQKGNIPEPQTKFLNRNTPILEGYDYKNTLKDGIWKESDVKLALDKFFRGDYGKVSLETAKRNKEKIHARYGDIVGIYSIGSEPMINDLVIYFKQDDGNIYLLSRDDLSNFKAHWLLGEYKSRGRTNFEKYKEVGSSALETSEEYANELTTNPILKKYLGELLRTGDLLGQENTEIKASKKKIELIKSKISTDELIPAKDKDVVLTYLNKVLGAKEDESTMFYQKGTDYSNPEMRLNKIQREEINKLWEPERTSGKIKEENSNLDELSKFASSFINQYNSAVESMKDTFDDKVREYAVKFAGKHKNGLIGSLVKILSNIVKRGELKFDKDGKVVYDKDEEGNNILPERRIWPKEKEEIIDILARVDNKIARNNKEIDNIKTLSLGANYSGVVTKNQINTVKNLIENPDEIQKINDEYIKKAKEKSMKKKEEFVQPELLPLDLKEKLQSLAKEKDVSYYDLLEKIAENHYVDNQNYVDAYKTMMNDINEPYYFAEDSKTVKDSSIFDEQEPYKNTEIFANIYDDLNKDNNLSLRRIDWNNYVLVDSGSNYTAYFYFDVPYSENKKAYRAQDRYHGHPKINRITLKINGERYEFTPYEFAELVAEYAHRNILELIDSFMFFYVLHPDYGRAINKEYCDFKANKHTIKITEHTSETVEDSKSTKDSDYTNELIKLKDVTDFKTHELVGHFYKYKNYYIYNDLKQAQLNHSKKPIIKISSVTEGNLKPIPVNSVEEACDFIDNLLTATPVKTNVDGLELLEIVYDDDDIPDEHKVDEYKYKYRDIYITEEKFGSRLPQDKFYGNTIYWGFEPNPEKNLDFMEFYDLPIENFCKYIDAIKSGDAETYKKFEKDHSFRDIVVSITGQKDFESAMDYLFKGIMRKLHNADDDPENPDYVLADSKVNDFEYYHKEKHPRGEGWKRIERRAPEEERTIGTKGKTMHRQKYNWERPNQIFENWRLTDIKFDVDSTDIDTISADKPGEDKSKIKSYSGRIMIFGENYFVNNNSVIVKTSDFFKFKYDTKTGKVTIFGWTDAFPEEDRIKIEKEASAAFREQHLHKQVKDPKSVGTQSVGRKENEVLKAKYVPLSELGAKAFFKTFNVDKIVKINEGETITDKLKSRLLARDFDVSQYAKVITIDENNRASIEYLSDVLDEIKSDDSFRLVRLNPDDHYAVINDNGNKIEFVSMSEKSNYFDKYNRPIYIPTEEEFEAAEYTKNLAPESSTNDDEKKLNKFLNKFDEQTQADILDALEMMQLTTPTEMLKVLIGYKDEKDPDRLVQSLRKTALAKLVPSNKTAVESSIVKGRPLPEGNFSTKKKQSQFNRTDVTNEFAELAELKHEADFDKSGKTKEIFLAELENFKNLFDATNPMYEVVIDGQTFTGYNTDFKNLLDILALDYPDNIHKLKSFVILTEIKEDENQPNPNLSDSKKRKLKDGFNNEEYKEFIALCEKLNLLTMGDVKRFSESHGNVKDKELLAAMRLAAEKLVTDAADNTKYYLYYIPYNQVDGKKIYYVGRGKMAYVFKSEDSGYKPKEVTFDEAVKIAKQFKQQESAKLYLEDIASKETISITDEVPAKYRLCFEGEDTYDMFDESDIEEIYLDKLPEDNNQEAIIKSKLKEVAKKIYQQRQGKVNTDTYQIEFSDVYITENGKYVQSILENYLPLKISLKKGGN